MNIGKVKSPLLHGGIAFFLGIMIVLGVMYFFFGLGKEAQEKSFKDDVGHIVGRLKEDTKNLANLMKTTQVFFAASGLSDSAELTVFADGMVDRNDFHIFTDPYTSGQHGINSLFFCPAVFVKDIDLHKGFWVKQSSSTFAISPVPPIDSPANKYVCPVVHENNIFDAETHLGIDLASYDVYRDFLSPLPDDVNMDRINIAPAGPPFFEDWPENQYALFSPVETQYNKGIESGYIIAVVDAKGLFASGMDNDLSIKVTLVKKEDILGNIQPFEKFITFNALGTDWTFHFQKEKMDAIDLTRIKYTFIIGIILSFGFGYVLYYKASQRVKEIIYLQRLRVERDFSHAARVEADKSNAAKSEFLANMSHELRTPLNSIIGMAQLVDYATLDNETKECFDSIKISSGFLLEVVNDILDISKIEANQINLENIPFDVCSKIDQVVQSLKQLASEKGLLIHYHPAQESVWVYGDPLRVGRIFINLIGNAIKYTLQGSITIEAEFAPSDKEDVIILKAKVIDTGIGIDPKNYDRIFEKFGQADSSITRKFGGTGLGLAITKNLILKMGGEIGIDSVLGEGSTFWFNLPFKKTERNQSEESGSDSVVLENKKTALIPLHACNILMAEDQKMNQIFMKKLLQTIGADQYKIVENGADAIEEAKKSKYDVILMDCHMPLVDGYQATRTIRTIPGYDINSVPIIALTANALPTSRQECLDAGMSEYISKPVDINEFKRILSIWINLKENKKPEDGAKEMVDEEKKQSDAGAILETSNCPYDLTNLKSNSMGDDSFVSEIIEIFVTQAANQISQLAEHAVSGESYDWVEISHALKGTAATLGAEKLRKTCEVAQNSNPSTDAIRADLLQKMQEEYNLIKKHLIAENLYTE